MRSSTVRTLGQSIFLSAALAAVHLPMHAQDVPPPPPPDQVSSTDTDQAKPASDSPKSQKTAFPARLSDVEGSVQIQGAPQQADSNTPPPANSTMPPAPPQETVFNAATVNMPVMEGMTVSTGDDGRAELQFNDGSFARVTPNSGVTVVSLANGTEILQPARGLTYFQSPDASTGQANVTISFGSSRLTLDTGTFIRVDGDQLPYKVSVIRGAAHSADSGATLTIDAGQTAVLDPNSPRNTNVAEGIQENSWDQWNDDRNQAQSQLASGQTQARDASGDGDAAGWNDLDYYGSWYDVPGQGLAWAPDGVDADFDPYGSGAWGYYSGVGYTWVSAYPWGWLPYRCGGWNYFGGYGWMWQPGGCGGFGGGGWYGYTRIHHAPDGYRLPGVPRAIDPRVRARLSGIGLPRSQTLIRVNRAHYDFRQLGSTRPEPRTFAIASHHEDSGNGATATAPVLPVLSAGQFQYRNRVGNSFTGGVQPVPGQSLSGAQRSRVVYNPGENTTFQQPRTLAPQQPGAPVQRTAPPPTMRAAPPVMRNTPPPSMRAPSPPPMMHMSPPPAMHSAPSGGRPH